MSKPRVIKDYEQLSPDIQEQIKMHYPNGFHNYLVSYVDKTGHAKKALPFETETHYYLIRMSVADAKKIISDDDDYDSDGILRDEVMEEYQGKYEDDFSDNGSDDNDNSYSDDAADDDDQSDDDDDDLDY